jgi:hypothetical protein
MGSLTDNGYQLALDLGAQLRRTYIDQHKLLPARQLDAQLLHVESTAVQRTVTTLRGVLNGLYPNSSEVVRVAVRPFAQETMTADWQGCPVLGILSQQLAAIQNARGELAGRGGGAPFFHLTRLSSCQQKPTPPRSSS